MISEKEREKEREMWKYLIRRHKSNDHMGRENPNKTRRKFCAKDWRERQRERDVISCDDAIWDWEPRLNLKIKISFKSQILIGLKLYIVSYNFQTVLSDESLPFSFSFSPSVSL
jgi:hypothetical protein